ncbi:MAG: hypothetical protein AAGL68_02995 [Pseudomonadota bacterium]
MRQLAFVIASTLLLAACGSETSGTIEGEDGEVGEYSIDSESGETTATIKTDEGEAVIRSGENIDVDLPAGFSVYPGAKVVHNTSVTQGATTGAMVVMESEDTAEDIAEFYRQQADGAGIKIEFEMSMDDGQMLGGKNEAGETFTLNTVEEGDRRTIQLMVGTDPANSGG